jgi:tetratricopeptide (TPR) repeat protein
MTTGRAVRRTAAAALASAILAVAGSRAAHADRLDEAWRRGNDAYLHGDYGAAIVAYEELRRQGIASADLYFNLGDAYFRNRALGPAIWAFERAVALDPSDEDARFNLVEARKLAAQTARDRIQGEEREPVWVRAVTALGPATEAWLFVGTYVGFFALLFVRRRVATDARTALGAAAAVLAAAALVSGALLAGRAELARVPFGVVLPDAVAVKDGADASYHTSFELHAGLKVRLVDRDQDWLRIRLGNGLEGWVRADQIGTL